YAQTQYAQTLLIRTKTVPLPAGTFIKTTSTITNPKEDLKGIMTRSGVAYKGPTIPTPFKVVKQGAEVTKDQVQTPSPQSTSQIQPPVTQSETSVSEPSAAPVSVPMPNLKPSIPYPSRRDNEKRQLSLPELTPTCMTLELADRSVSKSIGIAKDVSVKVGMFHFPADFVVIDFEPDPPSPFNSREFTNELKAYEAKTIKSSVDEPLEVELKDLPPHLEYIFLEGDNKLPVIIAKELGDAKKAALIKVLKSHKRAIAWKLSDIQGINPEFCTHKILMEEDYKPVVQHQRRFNPKIHDVIKKEVEKLLDAGLIYPISDSPWVSPVHCVPKKGGFTVVKNEENELIPNRLVTGWQVCIDYRKLNEATRKDHFPLPFMDQMLERLAENEYYCFLDGFYGYF
nr:reverse transcriptase domain-containing protein [Tanacetum cinerariifolium]